MNLTKLFDGVCRDTSLHCCMSRSHLTFWKRFWDWLFIREILVIASFINQEMRESKKETIVRIYRFKWFVRFGLQIAIRKGRVYLDAIPEQQID